MVDVQDANLDDNCFTPALFLSDWNSLFGQSTVNLKKLESKCVNGSFRMSQLRSIAWRKNLKILPLNKSEWIGSMKKCRNFYENAKRNVFIPDPHSEVYSDMNIEICNPLFTNLDNPWQRMFENQSLLFLIKKDLDRTFSEINFFQNEQVRQMLTDILVVTAKLYPERNYLQGMQEVLAPLLMVVIQDQRAYKRQETAKALKNVSDSDRSILDYVNDINFAEHDAFAMFQKVMEITGEWHGTAINYNKKKVEKTLLSSLKRLVDKRKLHTFHLEMFSDNDFQEFLKPQRRSKNELNPLERKMDYLHFELLPKYDQTLSYKFQFFIDSFAAYGFRFLPLMFVREFSIINGDLLLLWDAIFASNNGKEFVLIDYIFIAILLRLRDKFMNGGYVECHCLLSCNLKFNNVENILKFALALGWPNEYKIPKEYRSNLGTGILESFRNAAKAALYRFEVVRKSSINTAKDQERLTNKKSDFDGIFSRLLGTPPSSSTLTTEFKPSQQSFSTFFVDSVGGDNFFSNRNDSFDSNYKINNKFFCNKDGDDDNHRLLIKQVAELQTRLNEFDLVTKNAIKSLDKGICFLCETFFVLSSKLANIESVLSNTNKYSAGQWQLKPKNICRRVFKSESDFEVFNFDSGDRKVVEDIYNNSFKIIENINTINVNDCVKTISNNKMVKEKFVKTLFLQNNVEFSSFKNEVEDNIKPDAVSVPVIILIKMLRENVQEGRDKLIMEFVDTYIRLLRVTTGDGELATVSRSHNLCDSSVKTESSVTINLDSCELPLKRAAPLLTKSRRRHKNSTSSTKSLKNSHSKSRKRLESFRTSEDNNSVLSTLRRYKDPTLPYEIAAAIALNLTANAQIKANTKGIELKVFNNYKKKKRT